MVLVDSNVLLDVILKDPNWLEWSAQALKRWSKDGAAINPIIYAELAPAFKTAEELHARLTDLPLLWLPLPYRGAWRASVAFMEYKRRGGSRVSPMPDFYIGAHAEVENLVVLTRDAARYRTYFPALKVICPTH